MQDQNPEFEKSWLEVALRKRESHYSNCIAFQTSDPVRSAQLKFCLSNHALYKESEILLYDGWMGLGMWEKVDQGRFCPIPSGNQSGGLLPRSPSSAASPSIYDSLAKAEQFLKNKRCVLIIENLPSAAWNDGQLASAVWRWSVDPVIAERGSIVFLLCDLIPKEIDGLGRALYQVSIPKSSPQELEELLAYFQAVMVVPPENGNQPILLRLLAGLDLHQAEAVLTEAHLLDGRLAPERVKQLKTELIQSGGMLEVVYPRWGFESVGGYQVAKEYVQSSFIQVMNDAQRAERLGVPLPRGILFFGPPRTGKTLFARALAKELNIPFLNLRTNALYSKWLGESGQRMTEMIRQVQEMGKVLLFVDEIDRLGGHRYVATDGGSEETRRVFSEMLEWLGSKERQAIVVGTSNVPDHLDPAFLASGRLDCKIPFLYPDLDDRKQIVKIHLGLEGGEKSKPQFGFDETALEEEVGQLAARTPLYNGAELEELTNRIRRSAFLRGAEAIEAVDFQQAFAHFRINRKARELELMDYCRFAEEYADDPRFLQEMERLRASLQCK